VIGVGDRGWLAYAAWIGTLAAKIGQMVRNSIYVGRVKSPDYGVSTRDDFEPLIDEATLYRAQAVLDRRVVVAGPRQRTHPDFPLRGFVRCEACGRPLTGSWSKGRNGHYAYYHCQRQCRAVNVSKATLDGAFVDELELLQPTPGHMRLVKDRILCVWEQRRAEAKERATEQQRRVSAIQQKLDKLDEAFLYSESIDVTTYGRQRDKLREELTLAKIDHHAEAVDELDVEGILAFAEPICRAPQTCGSRHRSITSSDCSSCSFRKESRTTEIESIEPPQRHHCSTTWRRLRVLM
jgi:hypothetical protein